ncbi:restriction endonuclease-like protein [Natranaerobius thermophilus]|uniref:DUF2357 domain-containing protein n=1 Tax=Natranaerobius thermophilus (strain ATCC BAA-1301 / DSM 18059 / JW/NM-WN-LF) TaxID=457570 RepID=B2A7S4_NATTJ|nr:restriction endonuclease-like protein [Natranaerobius thermophilus]ACB84376.1 conserved hypothetical protein [Natranaerobius thermophilus JW/NM-WN-LF]
MASLHSGSKLKELLVIETDRFTLSIKGLPVNKNNDGKLHNIKQKRSYVSVESFVDQSYQVKIFDPKSPSGLRPYYYEGMPPCFFEQTNYEVVLEVNDGNNDYKLTHDNPHLDNAVTPTGSSGQIYTGVINFHNDIGFSRFVLEENGVKIFSFEIEVFPSKLDYIEDFYQMLQEVNQEIYNLAFDFLRRTYFSAQITKEETPSEAEFYTIISAIFKEFYNSLERVKNQPHHKIVPSNKVVRPEKAKKNNKDTLKWLQKRPNIMQKSSHSGIAINNNNYIPRKILDTKKEFSYDTYENRFLKWILLVIDKKLKRFSEKLNNEQLEVKEEVQNEINKMRSKLRHFINYSFLQFAGRLTRLESSSLVMQMGQGYRDVYKYYLMMKKGLNLTSDFFDISIKDVALLYEYWCFLKLNSLLRNKYQLEYNDLISLDRSGIIVKLKKGRESQLTYRDPKTNEQFTVAYNRAFNNLPTVGQHPDNILSIKKSDSNVRYQYIFDAKYRLDTSIEYKQKFNQIGPPVDTINAMHRYRDAIVANNKHKEDYTRDIFGAFVLFPHNNEQKFAGLEGGKPSKFYDSISEISIGALPFLPSQAKLVKSFLDDLLLESSDTAFERSVIQQGTRNYFDKQQQISDVLIGPLRRAEQLELCLNNNMYYTYLDQVKNQLGLLRYIALYQSKRKFQNQQEQGIFYYGKIQEYYIIPRKEIKEVKAASQPNELAVKFIVDEWKKLDKPIKPQGYGPQGPQFTNWYLFREAETYPELHLTWEEMRLLKELRRIENQAQFKFPTEMIKSDERFELIEFPELIIERVDQERFKVITDYDEEIFKFQDLRGQARVILKNIIEIWKLGVSNKK